jgi:hypothetical protein
MPKSIDSSQEAHVPDEVLCRLAGLAKVPNDERELFFVNVREAVQTAWERHEITKGWPRKSKIKALEKTASTIYKSLRNLDKHESDLIKQLLDDREIAFDRILGERGVLEAAYQVAHLFSILTGKPPPANPHQQPRAPKRGKPSGSVTNWIFQDFVFDLDLSARVAGGRLTLNKNIPKGKGTLILAIELLADHLPNDFLPQKPPSAATLQRIKDAVSAAEKQAKELE